MRVAVGAKNSGTLVLCGLGIGRPFDVTSSTLEALRACSVVFGPGHRSQTRALVESIGKPFRPVPDAGRPGQGGELEAIWSEVRAELERGRRAGFLTYGHPLVFAAGQALAELCRRDGFEVEIVACASAVDHLLAWAWGSGRGAMFAEGWLVRSAAGLASGAQAFDPSTTTVAFQLADLAGGPPFAAFCRNLERAYPKGHPVFLVQCADGGNAEVALETTAAGLRSEGPRLTSSMSLVVPARARARNPERGVGEDAVLGSEGRATPPPDGRRTSA